IDGLYPRDDLCAEEDAEEDQCSAAPNGTQRHPTAQPAKGPPTLTHRRCRKIVEGFGKLAAALRKKYASGIQFISGLQASDHHLLQLALCHDLRGARGATCEVRFNLFAFLLAHFIAHVEDQERRNVLAAQ